MESASEHDRYVRQRPLLLVLCGLAIIICFWILAALAIQRGSGLVYGVRGSTYAGPIAWMGRLLGLSRLGPLGRRDIYVALLVAASAAYAFAAFLVRRDDRRSLTAVIVGGFLLLALILVFLPPVMSRDVYSYSFYGRATTVYGANPYLARPVQFSSDMLYPLIGWKNTASAYGPLFNSISALVALVSGRSIWANVMLYKLLAFASFAACLPLVFALTRNVSPRKENFSLVVVAWSPLLALHILGGGHNEMLMVFFVLAGFWLMRRGYPFWGIVSILVAVGVKAIAVLALAPYLVFYIRDVRGRPVRRLAGTVVAVVAIPFAMYLPYWQGLKIFKTLGDVSELYSFSSVPAMAQNAAIKILKHLGITSNGAATTASSLVRTAFFLVFVCLVLLLLWRVRDYRSMLTAAAGVVLVWFLTSAYILPWYLALALCIAVLAGWNATTGATMAAATVFLLYRIPAGLPSLPGTVNDDPARPLSVLWLALPFLAIFLAWLTLQLRGLRES